MMGFSWQLASAAVDGAALANSSALTSILPAVVPSTNGTLRAKFLNYAGQELAVEAAGRISTLVTTPGTLSFALRFGSTSVALSGALALNAVAKTNVTWRLRWDLSLRAVGASANFMHTGVFVSEAVIGSPLPSAGGSGLLLFPASAPAVGANFSSLTTQAVDLQAQWSVANSANSITLHQFRIGSPN